MCGSQKFDRLLFHNSDNRSASFCVAEVCRRCANTYQKVVLRILADGTPRIKPLRINPCDKERNISQMQLTENKTNHFGEQIH